MKKLFLVFIFLAVMPQGSWSSDNHWDADFSHVGPFKIGMSYLELRRSSHSRLSGEQNFLYSNDKKILCGYLGFTDIDDPGIWFTIANDKLAAIHVESPKILFMGSLKVGDPESKIFEVYKNNAKLAPELDVDGRNVEVHLNNVEVHLNNNEADFTIYNKKISAFHIGSDDWRIDNDKSCQ